jgi:Kef-type K+ transport system membrane component KefB
MLRRSLLYGYIWLVGLPLLALAAILYMGHGLHAPVASRASGSLTVAGGMIPNPSVLNLFTLILQIGVVLLAARITGLLFRRLHQPLVMGEMAAGIMLGPSLLGWLAPPISAALFPVASMGYLNGLSQLGLVLFMFLTGLALNPTELRDHGHAAVLISHVSIVVPFTLAAGLSLFLYPRLSFDGVPFTGFALFMGAAMSITAFPVLARILAERQLMGTRMGTLAIACAAVDDVTGWCVLAFIVVLIRAGAATTPPWVTLGGSLVYLTVMLLVLQR